MINTNTNKRSITLTEDLIEDWVKNTGKPKELLEEMLKLHYKYLDYLIDNDPNAIIIKFPMLGKLRFNFLLGKQFKTKMPNSKGIKEKFSTLEKIMRKEGNRIINFNMPMLGKQMYQKTLNYPQGLYVKMYKYWTVLENTTNEWYINNYEN